MVVFTAGRPAGYLVTVIIEDLAAGTAGPRVAHLPEVVLIQTGKSLPAHTDLVEPDIGGLVIGDVHRHPQALFGQAQLHCQKLPGKADRVALEVVAEAEIAKHFEKGVVSGGIADIFEVVVLAAGADAALAGAGANVVALFQAQEDVLELIHARVGEQEGRVVMGHQRGTGHAGVLLALEIIEEGLTDFVGVHRTGA